MNECALCEYTSPRYMNLKRHLQSTSHNKRVKEAEKLKRFTMGPYELKSGFYCEMCDFRTHSLSAIHDHVFPKDHKERFETWLEGEYVRLSDKWDMECIDYDLTINEYGQVFVQVYE